MNKRRIRLAMAAVAIALLAGLGARAWARWEEKHQRHGIYTAVEAMEAAQPICRTILADSGDFRMSADALTLNTRYGSRRVWTVYCLDNGGTVRAFVLLNADTGQPFSINDTCRRSLGVSGPGLTRRAATQVAKSWMRNLGVARTASHWKLASEPLRTPGGWIFTWRARFRTARVVVDALTGDLIAADISRRVRTPSGRLIASI